MHCYEGSLRLELSSFIMEIPIDPLSNTSNSDWSIITESKVFEPDCLTPGNMRKQLCTLTCFIMSSMERN